MDKHRGSLYLRFGPMWAGKTTWLNGELTELSDTGFTVLKIVHADDVRDNFIEAGSTHNSSFTSLSFKIDVVRAGSLASVDVTKYNVIGIDESQFFPDLVKYVTEWVENHGKHVRAVGLDGDANKQKFGSILDLIPLADEVLKLQAKCRFCLNELEKLGFRGNITGIGGPFTKRITPSVSGAQKDVGGADKYIPVCRYHHSL